MTFRPELIDELLKDYKNVDDLMAVGSLILGVVSFLCLSPLEI